MAPTHLRNPWSEIVERLVQLGQAVPADVELGYHLCYGDAAHRHFKEPADIGLVVRLANEVASQLIRPLTWIHLPVPRSRDDDGYFAPLAELQLQSETEVYLGLVHYGDGTIGAERRIGAARRHLTGFGVATECGLGRRSADTVPELLRIHAAVAAPHIGPGA
jgi:methionine synthase II (cobalamin-independent)